MKYRKIVVEDFGGPEVLKIKSLISNKTGKNNVGIRILAAGVGFSDILTQRGGYIR